MRISGILRRKAQAQPLFMSSNGTIEFSPEKELLRERIGWPKGHARAQIDLADPESDGHVAQLPIGKSTYDKWPKRPDRALTKCPGEPAPPDPDLDRLRNAWPTLPPYLKAAILALASTGCADGGYNPTEKDLNLRRMD